MSELYFNLLPIDIIIIISTYLDTDEFSYFSLNFNDYISRGLFEFYYTDFYREYKKIRKDIGIRLNKLLSIYSYYIDTLLYFKEIREDFIDNFNVNYYSMNQHEFMRLQELSEQSLEANSLTEVRNRFPDWVETFSSILLLLEYPKMYHKIDINVDDQRSPSNAKGTAVRNVLYNPYYNTLKGCLIIDNAYNEHDKIDMLNIGLYKKYIDKGILPIVENVSELTNFLYHYQDCANILFLIILDMKKRGDLININKKNVLFSSLYVNQFYRENFHLLVDLILN